MGRAKQEWIEYLESEAMYEWIEENYGDDAGEEGSEEWKEAVQAFDDYCEEQARLAQETWEKDEYGYYLFLTPNDAYTIFEKDISELRDLLNNSNSETSNSTFCKMVYAHTVTILEVYLEDTVKALIASENNQYLENTIKNVRPFSDTKFKLSDISLNGDGIKKFVLRKLSENTFHDIPKVVKILCGVVGDKFDIKIDDICNVTSTRHDIVHRNGKNKGGDTLVIDTSSVLSAINVVEAFAHELRKQSQLQNITPLS